jgi:tetratricopeptide (TPR) repeat protein
MTLPRVAGFWSLATWIGALLASVSTAQDRPAPQMSSPAQQAILSLYQGAAASQQSGQYAEAIVQYEEAIRRTKLLAGENHLSVGLLLARAGTAYQGAKKYADAETRFRQSLAILRGSLSAEDRRVTLVVNELARSLHEQGRFADSAQLNR